MPSILFICSANMFRSPLAAAILQKEIDKLDNSKEWIINSAGTWTTNGLPPPEITRQIGLRLELTGIKNHRTCQVDEKLLTNTDLIIVMETNHKESLTTEFPTIKDRVFLLTEVIIGKIYDIPDPVRLLIDADEVANELERLLSSGLDRVLAKAKILARDRNSETPNSFPNLLQVNNTHDPKIPTQS